MSSYSSKTTKAAGGVYIDADKEQTLNEQPRGALIDLKNNKIIFC